jgi:hypothetical protein
MRALDILLVYTILNIRLGLIRTTFLISGISNLVSVKVERYLFS